MNYKTQIEINDADIAQYMEEMLNKPGAAEFLTPREIIREFLNILSLVRQNPDMDKNTLIQNIEITDKHTTEMILDGIDEL